MENRRDMFESSVLVLAAIDEALGLPDDGCNSSDRTLEAIARMKRVETNEGRPTYDELAHELAIAWAENTELQLRVAKLEGCA